MSIEVLVTGRLPEGATTRAVTYFIVDTSRTVIVGQVILPDVAPGAKSVAMPVRIPPSAGPLAIGTFDHGGTFSPVAFLNVEAPAAPGGGDWR